MSQEYLPINASVPEGDTGPSMVEKINKGREALLSGHSGGTAPVYAIAGTIWRDTSATPWTMKMFDGSDWIALYQVNPTTNVPIYPGDEALAAAVVTVAAVKAVVETSPQIVGLIERPANKTYLAAIKIKYACTIKRVTTRASFGTCTFAVRIDGSPIDGSSNAVSTSEQTQEHDQAVSAGQDISIVISANSNCLDIAYNIELERSVV